MTTTPTRRSVLLLCDDDARHANTVHDHIRAFPEYSGHRISTFNPRSLEDPRFLELDDWDVVVLHYSLCAIVDEHVSPALREKIRRFSGLKIQFIQDEYRWVDEISDMMRYLGIHVLFTLVPAAEIPKVWREGRLPGLVTIGTLAGYVPENLVGLAVPPTAERPIDIGYRGRELPFWLGLLGQEKVQIGRDMLARASRYGLRCDIAWTEADRIHGRAWIEFVTSCKATLGTESGATITDFDGSVERQVREYLARRPGADFEEVFREVLRPYEGNVRINVVSPRIFEAIALRTALILFPGDYSGVVQPDLHYIPLAKDFSNLDEVVKRLRDHDLVRAMTERAYAEIVASRRYSYRRLVEQFDGIVTTHMVSQPRAPVAGIRRSRPAREWRLALARRHAGMARRLHVLGVERHVQRALRTVLAFSLVFRYPESRRLLVKSMMRREIRDAVGAGILFRDLIKLGLLRGISRSRSPRHRLTVTARLAAETLELSTRRPCASGTEASTIGDRRAGVATAALSRIVWNNSAIGPVVEYDLGRLVVEFFAGPEGRHEFRGLVALIRWYPDDVRAAVAPLTGAGARGGAEEGRVAAAS